MSKSSNTASRRDFLRTPALAGAAVAGGARLFMPGTSWAADKPAIGTYPAGSSGNSVFVTGLATDFCVAWTALDARKLGFTAYVIEDATRGIDLNGSLAAAWKDMTAAGVKRIQSSDIA